MNEKVGGEYVYKYSGGFATYPQWHAPVAIHAPAVQKTFFVLGGSGGAVSESGDRLVHLVGAFDHRTGEVSRPVRLLDKQTEDAHDNPVLSIDGAGHLWVFSAAHGTSRPAYIHRSRQPYDLSAWDLVQTSNFSYPQPWYLPGRGEFLFLHTRYQQGQRSLFFEPIARRPGLEHTGEAGAHRHGRLPDLVADRRSRGHGVRHAPLDGPRRPGPQLPIEHLLPRDARCGPHVEDRRRAAGDAAGDRRRARCHACSTRSARTAASISRIWPSMSGGTRSSCTSRREGSGRVRRAGRTSWFTARWTGAAWEHRRFTESDHNYDHGSLFIEADGHWRVIAPTDPGPQPFGTGGEMVLWISSDRGATWTRARTLTAGSARNHSYARKPLGAHPDLYAIWADGDARQPSRSVVHIATRDGDVYALPERMSAGSARPTRLVGPDR